MRSQKKRSNQPTVLILVLFVVVPALLALSNLVLDVNAGAFLESPPPIGTHGVGVIGTKPPLSTPATPTPTGTSPPVNDDLISALVIGPLPFSTTQTSLGADIEAGEPGYACGYNVGATVWYSFTPTADGLFRATTYGSSFDTVVHVFEYDGGFPLVVCSDDVYSRTSETTFEGQAGTTYLISIGGYNGAAGDISLEVEQVCTDPNSLCVTARYPSGGQTNHSNTDVKRGDGSEADYEEIKYHGTWIEYVNIAPGSDYLVAVGDGGLFIIEEGVTAPGILTAAQDSVVNVAIEARNIDGDLFNYETLIYFTYNNASVLVGSIDCYYDDCPPDPLNVAASPGTVHIDAWVEDNYYYFYQPDHTLVDGETISLDASTLTYETVQVNLDGMTDVTLYLSSPTINRTYRFGYVSASDLAYIVAPLDSSEISVFNRYVIHDSSWYWFGFALPSITMDTHAQNTVLNMGGTFTGYAYTDDPDLQVGEVGNLFGVILDEYGNTAYEFWKTDYWSYRSFQEPRYYLNDALSNPAAFNELGDRLNTYIEFTPTEPSGTWEGGFTIYVGPMGGTIGDSVLFNITNPSPVVEILTPPDEAVFYLGDPITFTGTAHDDVDGDVTDTLSWESSIDGVIGSGGSFTRSDLSLGTHTITASATDADGQTGFAEITVSIIDNTAPIAEITSPPDGSSHILGDTVSFSGTANDNEDGDLTASLSWNSDLDGVIGTGGSFSRSDLSLGTHTITASVTDSQGLGGSAQVTITIAENTAPTVVIDTPPDGSSHYLGDVISFSGTANDYEEGDLTSRLTWISDLDGVIGYGGSFDAPLSEGTHIITAAADDSYKLEGSAQITVHVIVNTPPVVEIISPLDKSAFHFNAPITLVGSATDAQDGDISSLISWSSDLDGAIGVGEEVIFTSTTPGNHVITAEVTDAYGDTTQATIKLRIFENRPPVAIFFNPEVPELVVGEWLKSVSMFGDKNGAADILTLQVHLDAGEGNLNSLHVQYLVDVNELYLQEVDSENWIGPCTPGEVGTLNNGNVEINCKLTVPYTLAGYFIKLRILSRWVQPIAEPIVMDVFLRATDIYNNDSGFIPKGTWTLLP